MILLWREIQRIKLTPKYEILINVISWKPSLGYDMDIKVRCSIALSLNWSFGSWNHLLIVTRYISTLQSTLLWPCHIAHELNLYGLFRESIHIVYQNIMFPVKYVHLFFKKKSSHPFALNFWRSILAVDINFIALAISWNFCFQV